MKIILVGMPYSGKSTIAKGLAKQYRLPMVDTDTWIEEQLGCRITDIFAHQGEPAFRDYETQALTYVESLSQAVVATGGGIIITPINRDVLKQSCAIIIYLAVAPHVLVSRAERRNGPVRPLLATQSIESLFAQREQWYLDVATAKIDCSGKNVKAIITEISTIITDILAK